MKIVMNEKGAVVARHVEAANIPASQYADYGPVLIGIVPDDQLTLASTPAENDGVKGSTIDVARDLARQMVRDHVGQAMAELTVDYPQAERDTWSAKLAEARALEADSGAATVYLAAVAKATGKDVKAVAKSVIKHAEKFAAEIAENEAFRSDRYAAIDKAKNIKSVIAAVEGI